MHNRKGNNLGLNPLEQIRTCLDIGVEYMIGERG